MRKLIILSVLLIGTISCSNAVNQNNKEKKTIAFHSVEAEGTCSGTNSCSACKNCKYCKHCSKDGGSCGVCK